jgi:hypothetical protein
MNERLYQLMRQAQSVAYAKASAKKKTNSPQNNTVWNEFPEVFAELIVQECASVIEKNHPEFDCKESADNLIRRAGRMDAIDEISKHFEVEL